MINVILPTRKRTGVLTRSLTSLLNNADNPRSIEIDLGVDEDDAESLEYVNHELEPLLNKWGASHRVKIFFPMGYENLHKYANALSHLALTPRSRNKSFGPALNQWLLLWNDDALMETKGWDKVVKSYNGQFKCLSPKDNHHGHPFACFPIIPADWIMLTNGWATGNAHNDTWVSELAFCTGIFENIEINILHDRADLTGNNDDETFRESVSAYREKEFHSPQNRQARMFESAKIDWFLKKIGQTTSPSPFDKFVAGERDPFESFTNKNK